MAADEVWDNLLFEVVAAVYPVEYALEVDPSVITGDYEKLTGGRKEMVLCSTKKEIGLDEIISIMGL